MSDPQRIEFYTTGPQHRWRLVSAGNNEKLCTHGEAFTRRERSYRNAAQALGIAQRSDLVVPDPRDRLALARLLHRLYPEVSEQAWASQLDPEGDRAGYRTPGSWSDLWEGDELSEDALEGGEQ